MTTPTSQRHMPDYMARRLMIFCGFAVLLSGAILLAGNPIVGILLFAVLTTVGVVVYRTLLRGSPLLNRLKSRPWRGEEEAVDVGARKLPDLVRTTLNGNRSAANEGVMGVDQSMFARIAAKIGIKVVEDELTERYLHLTRALGAAFARPGAPVRIRLESQDLPPGSVTLTPYFGPARDANPVSRTFVYTEEDAIAASATSQPKTVDGSTGDGAVTVAVTTAALLFPSGPITLPNVRRTVTLGRQADVTIPCPDKSAREQMSRVHAEITLGKDGVWILRDVSRNGTLVNGIMMLDMPARLGEGDVITFGSDSTAPSAVFSPGPGAR